ncbi:hypothetical protein D3C72_1847510 [compost metagenome]
MATTRKAPTVWRAATVEPASRVKKTIFRRSGRRPIERAWFSSKKATMKSFHLAVSTTRLTPPISTSCSVSAGVMARILPSTMVWMFTETGESETMNRPRPKKEVKIRPMIASSLSRVRWLRKSMAAAASPPEMKAPKAKGRPSM